MSGLYFDDLHEGFRFRTRSTTLTEAQIIDFAFRYDPQAIHMDAHAAAESPYGGIIASGLHSLASACRLIQQDKPWFGAGMGSPGIEDLRWLQPVRPGDTIRAEVEVRGLRLSASKPDRGIVHLYHAVYNQDDVLVLTYELKEFVARRAPAADADPRQR